MKDIVWIASSISSFLRITTLTKWWLSVFLEFWVLAQISLKNFKFLGNLVKTIFFPIDMIFNSFSFLIFNQICQCMKSVQRQSFFPFHYFSIFRVNTEVCSMNLRTQAKYRKKSHRKSSLFKHLSSGGCSYLKKNQP